MLEIPYGLVARLPGFHPGGTGSIPGMGTLRLVLLQISDIAILFVRTFVMK